MTSRSERASSRYFWRAGMGAEGYLPISRKEPSAVRILIFHGYLLRGTGSNIYNASLVRALARLGHEVDLLCQERDWDAPEGVTVHNPGIGRVLPVYVADTYEGFDAKPYAQLSDAELDHYLDSNVAAESEAPPPPAA